MTDKPELCTVCNRETERMNSPVAECSHVDCPHRRKAWSDGVGSPRWRKPVKKIVPFDKFFDKEK